MPEMPCRPGLRLLCRVTRSISGKRRKGRNRVHRVKYTPAGTNTSTSSESPRRLPPGSEICTRSPHNKLYNALNPVIGLPFRGTRFIPLGSVYHGADKPKRMVGCCYSAISSPSRSSEGMKKCRPRSSTRPSRRSSEISRLTLLRVEMPQNPAMSS